MIGTNTSATECYSYFYFDGLVSTQVGFDACIGFHSTVAWLFLCFLFFFIFCFLIFANLHHTSSNLKAPLEGNTTPAPLVVVTANAQSGIDSHKWSLLLQGFRIFRGHTKGMLGIIRTCLLTSGIKICTVCIYIFLSFIDF